MSESCVGLIMDFYGCICVFQTLELNLLLERKHISMSNLIKVADLQDVFKGVCASLILNEMSARWDICCFSSMAVLLGCLWFCCLTNKHTNTSNVPLFSLILSLSCDSGGSGGVGGWRDGGHLFQEVCVICVSGWVPLFLFTIWSSVPDHSGTSVAGCNVVFRLCGNNGCLIFKAPTRSCSIDSWLCLWKCPKLRNFSEASMW